MRKLKLGDIVQFMGLCHTGQYWGVTALVVDTTYREHHGIIGVTISGNSSDGPNFWTKDLQWLGHV